MPSDHATHTRLGNIRALATPLLATVLLIAGAETVADSIDATPAPALPTPITIEADQFEVQYAQDKAIWTGDVSATQGNYTFRTSVLTIRLDQIGDPVTQEGESAEDEEGSKSRPAVNLTARKLSYDLEQALIIGAGDSELRRGEEIIRADRITYDVQARTAYAVPGDNGRVYVRFISNLNKPVLPGTALLPAGGQ